MKRIDLVLLIFILMMCLVGFLPEPNIKPKTCDEKYHECGLKRARSKYGAGRNCEFESYECELREEKKIK